MQSKTSYFNKTLFFKNITHYWPIWTAYLLVCLFRLPLALYRNLNAQAVDVTDIEAFRLSQFEETITSALQPFPFFLFACIAAVAVFSYLYQSRSAYMIHSLPVCRESLFITNVLSGICFLVIPQIIAFLAGIFICFLQQMTQLEYLMHWLILSGGMVIFAFALAVFTVMITGNIIAAPIFFIIINYLFVGCRTLISRFVETLSYGIDHAGFSFGSFLSPYYFLSSHFTGGFSLFSWFSYSGAQDLSLLKMYTYIGGYFAAGILFFILAFVIYKKKHLESVGDILAIHLLKPLFRWSSAFCLGSCIALFGKSLLVKNSYSSSCLPLILLFMALGCILAFFLADMLLQKKFFVFCKKRLLECGILTVLSVLFLIGVDFNLFGIENRIPQKEDIASVFLYGSYPIKVNENDYDKVLSIHQSLIDSKNEIEDYFKKYGENPSYSTLDLTYTLKNGSIRSRRYYIPVEEYYLDKKDYIFWQIADLSQNPEYYLRHHFTDAYESITFVDGSLDLYTGSPYLEYFTLDQAQCNQLYEAFKQDVKEGNYKIYDYSIYDQVKEKFYYNTLYLTYSVPLGSSYASYSGIETVHDSDVLQATSINLTTDCVHTLQLLEELGILTENQKMITQKESDVLNEAQEDYKDAEVFH